jgi:tetratricopeptide (TPR) repeat protein
MATRAAFTLLITISSLTALTFVSGHGAYHAELEKLDARVAAAPDHPEHLLTRAKLHLGHKEWQPALDDVERVDRLAPGRYPTDGLRGAALNLGKHWQAALRSLDAHLQAKPSDAEAKFQRARTHRHLHAMALSVADYRDALRVHPQVTHEYLAEAAEAIEAQEGPAAAIDFLDEFHRFATEPAVSMQVLSLAEKCGDTDRALKEIAFLQQQAPRPEPWMARSAKILHQAKRTRQAKAAWIALHEHLIALPSLERGMPQLIAVLRETETALGIQSPTPVSIAPAP